jgi:hypothetical protein
MDEGRVTMLREELEACLEDLESRIDESIEAELRAQWRRFCDLEWPEPVFAPRRPVKSPPRVPWPDVALNDALDDFDLMMLHQLRGCSDQLADGSGGPLMVRANYGTPLLALPFGAELFLMPRQTNTLPASTPLAGGTEALRAVVERGDPPLDHPHVAKVFEMGRRFVQTWKQYPKIARYVFIYHPDLQGPLDVLELVWGSEMFIGLMDEPQLAHAALDLITRTYIRFMRQWESITPLQYADMPGYTGHWGMMLRGRIIVRNDSAMNLSPEMFETFSRPYDQRLLETFEGAMHACGRVQHFAPLLPGLKGLHAFHMTQPHLNDMNEVWPHTIGAGRVLIGFDPAAARAARDAGVDLRGRVQV